MNDSEEPTGLLTSVSSLHICRITEATRSLRGNLCTSARGQRIKKRRIFNSRSLKFLTVVGLHGAPLLAF